ncbi:hypothetical protein SLEP1_g1125 [Rubroshorea leprosula]|uniref:Uncharacterized protein n=1 Tax=Rubroshorea leprosula TaxID=152421 RepID=A0AAV5HLK4_9ROSI|nr:hypothetical protein SLEP1_g1125 [Rubroshorea leprosula]
MLRRTFQDPVCGSAHCVLTPYWSQKQGKCDFIACEASPRGGIINIHLDKHNRRVVLRGKTVTVMEGCLLFYIWGLMSFSMYVGLS